MATFTSQPYQAQDAKDFLDYMQRILSEMTRLQGEGRVPNDVGTNALLTFWRTMVAQVRMDVGNVGSSSRSSITSSVQMSEAEYQRTWSQYETFLQLLQILDMRGAVALEPSEGAMRIISALYKGSLT